MDSNTSVSRDVEHTNMDRDAEVLHVKPLILGVT